MKLSYYIYNLAFGRQVIILRAAKYVGEALYLYVGKALYLYVGKALYLYVGKARLWHVGGSLHPPPHAPLYNGLLSSAAARLRLYLR